MRIQVLYFVIAISLFFSCQGTKNVGIDAIRPADITLGQSVHEILLVDRTLPKNKGVSIIEGVLTGELPDEDRGAVQELMNTFKDQVKNSPRYNVKVASERLIGNSITTVFPEQLSWNEVDALCEKYGTQMLVAVEIFDTNFIPLDIEEVRRERNDPDNIGSSIEVVSYRARGTGKIKMGIRLYDPVTRSIIDQQLINRDRSWVANGDTRTGAAAALITKQRASLQMAKAMGEDYAYKLSPQPIVLNRKLYRKSKDVPELGLGTRLAEVNDWNEAINTWKKGIKNNASKEAGLLIYNIAVAYEVLGDFDIALEYARNAYTRYGNKAARNYVADLERRIVDAEKLEEQLKVATN